MKGAIPHLKLIFKVICTFITDYFGLVAIYVALIGP